MNIKQGIKIKGEVDIQVHDAASGKIIEERHIDNLVTNYGLEQMLKLIFGESSDTLRYQSVGSGTTAVAFTDTALVTEIPASGNRQTLSTVTIATAGGGFSGYRVSAKYTWATSQGNGTWAEAGLFTDNAGGSTCTNRVLISPSIVKDTSKTVTVSWILTLAYIT